MTGLLFLWGCIILFIAAYWILAGVGYVLWKAFCWVKDRINNKMTNLTVKQERVK